MDKVEIGGTINSDVTGAKRRCESRDMAIERLLLYRVQRNLHPQYEAN